MINHISSLRVSYSETDQMGVVYHGNYAKYFELGRTEWLRSLGVTYKDMEANGIMLPVISLNLKFLKSAFYDEVITVETILKKKPVVKIEFDYVIRNENKDILCTGNTVLAFIDMKTNKPMKCPDDILDRIGI